MKKRIKTTDYAVKFLYKRRNYLKLGIFSIAQAVVLSPHRNHVLNLNINCENKHGGYREHENNISTRLSIHRRYFELKRAVFILKLQFA